MTQREKLLKIQTENDQDLEQAKAWFRETGEADMMRVFGFIREMCDAEGVPAVVGRLAQLKFCELIVILESEGKR